MNLTNKNSILRTHWDSIISQLRIDEGNVDDLIIAPTLAELNNIGKTYYVTKKALDIIDTIDLTKASYSILNSLPITDKAMRFYIQGLDNDCHTFRYDGKMLHIAALAYDAIGTGGDDKPITYTHLKVNLQDNVFHCSHEKSEEQKHFNNVLMPMLVYVFLSDIDIQLLPINGDNGLSRADGKVKNQTTTPINLVTEKWNTVTIRVGDFGVRGHMRLQPCGPKRLQRKLVYIAPFMKHTYTRRN